MKCNKVEVVSKRKSDIPIVARFSNGSLSVKSGCEVVAGLYRDQKANADLLVVETSDMQYEGLIHMTHPLDQPKRQKLLCGFMDKKTGNLSVTNVNEVTLNPVALSNPLVNNIEMNSADATFRDKADNLALAFGTKKAQKYVSSRQSGKVTGNLLDDDMGMASSYVGENAEKGQGVSLVTNTSESDSWLTINWDANSPQDAYNLNDIIGDSLREAIRNYLPIHEFGDLSKESIQHMFQTKTHPKCILTKLGNILRDIESGNEEKAEERATVLLYLSWLIKLYNMKYRDINRKNLYLQESSPPPTLIISHLEETYTLVTIDKDGRKKRSFPDRLKDKCLCHIIVLLLTLSNYFFLSTDLLSDTNIKSTRLQDLSRNIGCSVSKSKEDAVLQITLKIPLKKFQVKPYNADGKSRGRRR